MHHFDRDKCLKELNEAEGQDYTLAFDEIINGITYSLCGEMQFYNCRLRWEYTCLYPDEARYLNYEVIKTKRYGPRIED